MWISPLILIVAAGPNPVLAPQAEQFSQTRAEDMTAQMPGLEEANHKALLPQRVCS